jgi:5'-3' exonuclease
MAVLPPASIRLLPPACHSLMLDTRSPIADFYPLTFDEDFEGKRNPWEAVVLLSFIDEKRLLLHVDGIAPGKV